MSLLSKSLYIRSSHISSWKSLLPLFVIWLVLIAGRPFFFGFYHDDWNSIALPLDRSADLISLLKMDAGRPLYLVLLYVLRPLLGAHTELWQLLLAMIHLLSAIAIRATACRLFAVSESDRGEPVGSIAGILWLVFPWSLGYSAWAIMLPPNLAMLLTICAFLVLLKSDINAKLVNRAVFLLAASWLIYEATWMFWLPFALILYVRAIYRKLRTACVIQFFVKALIVQSAFIAWNRYVSVGSPVSKSVSGKLTSTLEADLHLLSSQLIPSIAGKQIVLLATLLLLVCVVVNRKSWSKLPVNSLICIFLLVGMGGSVCIYAVAGYAIEWTGLFSRVTLPLSFWLAMLFSGVFALAWQGASQIVKKALIVSLVGIVLPLGTSLAQASLLWAKAWQEQQQILDAIPQSVVEMAAPSSLILFDIPHGTAPVYTFSAFWDISGAVVLRMPSFVRLDKPHTYATVARRGEWRTTWDGKVLKQYWCNNPAAALWSLEASELYLWTYPNDAAKKLAAPFEVGCNSPSIK